MGNRVFEYYDEVSFNSLYAFLKENAEKEDAGEWEKGLCEKIIEKLDTYSSVAEKDEGNFIKIGWFGEELRDILSLILYKFRLGESNNNYFNEIVERKKKQVEDPESYKKIRIRHLSRKVMFLSNEKEVFLKKSRIILELIGEKTRNLSYVYGDVPSRAWMCGMILKSRCTLYRIRETEEGYEIAKLFHDRKKKEQDACIYYLNNETFEYRKDEIRDIGEADIELMVSMMDEKNG